MSLFFFLLTIVLVFAFPFSLLFDLPMASFVFSLLLLFSGVFDLDGALKEVVDFPIVLTGVLFLILEKGSLFLLVIPGLGVVDLFFLEFFKGVFLLILFFLGVLLLDFLVGLGTEARDCIKISNSS